MVDVQLPTIELTAKFAGAGFEEIGANVRYGFRIQHGSQSPSLTGLVADPGSLSTVVENFARQFDPTFVTSPYYPDVVPGVEVFLIATWDSVEYPLFTGRVGGWPQTYGTAGLDQIVQLEAKDAVSQLARADVVGPFPRQRTGARIDAVIAATGISIDSTVDAGTALVPAVGEGSFKAWPLIADAVAAEWGYGFFFDGELNFLDRNGIAAVAEYTTPIAIFGDRPDLGELPHDDIEIPYDDTRTVNDADNSYNEHGDRAHAEDLSYVGDPTQPWGHLTWSQNIPMASGALARSYVKHVVRQYVAPTIRVSSMRIRPQDSPDDLWPIVLALKEGQMFTVKRTPIGGGARIERDVFVRSVSHELNHTEWVTDVTFDDANLVTVDAHYGDASLYGDGVLYSF